MPFLPSRPPPFSQQHGTYLKNYLTTGTPRVLDKRREVVAIHRDRYVFPIMLLVRKASAGLAAFDGKMRQSVSRDRWL